MVKAKWSVKSSIPELDSSTTKLETVPGTRIGKLVVEIIQNLV